MNSTRQLLELLPQLCAIATRAGDTINDIRAEIEEIVKKMFPSVSSAVETIFERLKPAIPHQNQESKLSHSPSFKS